MQQSKSKYQRYLPGLILTILIAIMAKLLTSWVPHIGSVTIAIILGILLANLPLIGKYIANGTGLTTNKNSSEKIDIKRKIDFTAGINFSKKKILSLAIILMGLELELGVLSELGFSVFFVVIIMIISSISLSFLMGKILGLSTGFSLLLGVGNGICGSSAIAASAPFLTDNEEEIGISIGVINFLGTVGIFLVPLLTYLLKLSITESSLMIGSTLQAVGQVVAAGFSVNNDAGKLSTVVKMARILMLGPVVIILGFLNINKANENPEKERENSILKKLKLPPFIIGFILMSIIASLNILPAGLIYFLKNAGKFILTIAMAAIGLKINLSSLLKQGPKALSVGILVFISQLILITLILKVFL